MKDVYVRFFSTLSVLAICFGLTVSRAQNTAVPRLSVAPRVALYDAPIRIRVQASPYHLIRIGAHMVDARGTHWQSAAVFRASAKGTIDLRHDAPKFGSYRSVSSMGLVWSMLPKETPGAFSLRDDLRPIHVKITAADGKSVAQTSVTRLRVLSHVRRTVVHAGHVVGVLFTPADERTHRGIVVLGGSEGGLDEGDAALFASHGFAALAAGYFGIDGLPKNLIRIPTETVEADVKYLQRRSHVSSNVAVVGISRGGELALLAGSLFPDIAAVVGIVPGSIVEPGLRFGRGPVNETPWTYRGKDLPYASFMQLSSYLKTGDVSAVRRAIIPVARIRGPVLLVSAGDDRLGFSARFAALAFRELKVAKHPFSDQLFNYPRAGHLIEPPYLPTANLQALKTPYGVLNFGGNQTAYAHADADSWLKILRFLKTGPQ